MLSSTVTAWRNVLGIRVERGLLTAEERLTAMSPTYEIATRRTQRKAVGKPASFGDRAGCYFREHPTSLDRVVRGTDGRQHRTRNQKRKACSDHRARGQARDKTEQKIFLAASGESFNRGELYAAERYWCAPTLKRIARLATLQRRRRGGGRDPQLVIGRLRRRRRSRSDRGYLPLTSSAAHTIQPGVPWPSLSTFDLRGPSRRR